MLQLAWPWVLAAVVLPIAVAWLVPAATGNAEAALRIPFFPRVAAWSDERSVHTRRWRVFIAGIW